MKTNITGLLLKKNEVIIDGLIDNSWESVTRNEINEDLIGDEDWSNSNDLSTYFKFFQNKEYLFFLLIVKDDIKGQMNDDNVSFWENDIAKLFFSNVKAKSQLVLGEKDTIYYYNFTNTRDSIVSNKTICRNAQIIQLLNSSDNTLFKRQLNTNAYVLEIKFPKQQINALGNTVLFDIEVTDNDNNSFSNGFVIGRESRLSLSLNGARNSRKETLNYGILLF